MPRYVLTVRVPLEEACGTDCIIASLHHCIIASRGLLRRYTIPTTMFRHRVPWREPCPQAKHTHIKGHRAPKSSIHIPKDTVPPSQAYTYQMTLPMDAMGLSRTFICRNFKITSVWGIYHNHRGPIQIYIFIRVLRSQLKH